MLSGVGDPFLSSGIRFHCPVYTLLKFKKPKLKSFKRHIWLYDEGNYDLLHDKATTTDWTATYDDNIDQYCKNITEEILDLCKQCIPNKNILIRPSEPKWINSNIKRKIRTRK